MKYFFIVFEIFFLFEAYGQIGENFNDGNFTANPSWMGDDSVFTVIDMGGNFKLRSNKAIPSSTFYLSSPSTQRINSQWEFFVQLQFNTSSLNYVDIYLTSDQSNLTSSTVSGYFVRIGGTLDEIALYRRVAGTAVKLIDGVDGLTNHSNNILRIKVKCVGPDKWTLERDVTGTGANYVSEGSVSDAVLGSSSFFGISIRQSTLSFASKHYFDDIVVGPIIPDFAPPQMTSASAVSSSQVDVLFNEALDSVSATNGMNYSISPYVGISSAVLDELNSSLVHLNLSGSLMNGNLYTLTSTNIRDVALNNSTVQYLQFDFLTADVPLPGDVIINEIMADPSPSAGQPEFEYIELYNRSTKYFNLNGWKISDGVSTGTLLEDWLLPGGYKVLCTTSASGLFAQTVPVTGFPSLNNTGDSIILRDNNGKMLDNLYYADHWYNDDLKAGGGYSLERINPDDPCSAKDNWAGSNASNGGTPGVQNSVFDNAPDLTAPDISELIAVAPGQLEIYFSEGVDSIALMNASISIIPQLNIASKTVAETFPHRMDLTFNEEIVPGELYQITITKLSDCWMNSGSPTGIFVLPETPEPGDLVINEILYDPYTGGSDWIEVYNNSSKLIDLKNWAIANFANDTIDNQKVIDSHYYLKGGEYVVLGLDSSFVKQHYPASAAGTFIHLETPSYYNDSGTVYLIFNNQVMDKVSYSSEWHFELLDNTDGVSLERIDPNGSSNVSTNWHSGAEAIGFATPGTQNSQYRQVVSNGEFNFSSPTVSPDNDGFEDVLLVTYQMTQPGLLGSCTIYDDRGRIVNSLFKNELLGSTGSFTWDGLTDKKLKAGIGTYIALFEAFSVNGGLMFSKTKPFVVAGKL